MMMVFFFDLCLCCVVFCMLYDYGCFVLFNLWDVGSVCYLYSFGFLVLVSISLGVVWSQGNVDGELLLEVMLDYLYVLVVVMLLLVNVDFGDGFGSFEVVGYNVVCVIVIGVVGIFIEDVGLDLVYLLCMLDEVVVWVCVVCDVIDVFGEDVILVGCVENFFVGCFDLDDVIICLCVYVVVGVDCLYVFGIIIVGQIQVVVVVVVL